ncbi:MAG: hypothetical protein WC073_12890 [Sterolibacterium sp.]
MKTSIKLKPMLASLAAVAMLTACAANSAFFSFNRPSEIYYKDGRLAYVASCKSANWGPCLEQAGVICKNAGYTILEKTNSRNYGEDEKEMVFACNGKPDAMGNKPASGDIKS